MSDRVIFPTETPDGIIDGNDKILFADVSDGNALKDVNVEDLPISNATQNALNNKVSKTGNETIDGIKTFTSSPKGPTPIANDDLATKGYVDSVSGGGGGGSINIDGGNSNSVYTTTQTIDGGNSL